MKRLLFFIIGWLLCGALSAQNINQCEYWYDNDFAGRQSVWRLGLARLQRRGVCRTWLWPWFLPGLL